MIVVLVAGAHLVEPVVLVVNPKPRGARAEGVPKVDVVSLRAG